MKFTVDSNPIEPRLVTYNDGLGYGRLDKDYMEVHAYSFELSRDELVQSFSTTFHETMEEVRHDDQATGESSPFKELGYVDLAEALQYPEHLIDAITTYFDRDIFHAYFPATQSFIYVINSTDRISISVDTVIIEGRCFRRQQPSNSTIDSDAARQSFQR